MQSGEKEENPRRFLPPFSLLPFRPDGEYKVRYNPDAQPPYSYSFNLLSQPPGFMGPQVLLAHPKASTPRVYPCAYASPAARFSSIFRISLLRTERMTSNDVGEAFFTKNLAEHSGLGRESMSFVCPVVSCRKIVASHICTIAILRMKRSRSLERRKELHLEIFVKNYNAVNRALSHVKNLCEFFLRK